MSKLTALANAWNSVRELDLRPIQQVAMQGCRIAIVGRSSVAMQRLAEHLQRDPSKPDIVLDSPLLVLDTAEAGQALSADLIILYLGIENEPLGDLFEAEKDLARYWAAARKRVLVIIHPKVSEIVPQAIQSWVSWGLRRIVYADPEDAQVLQKKLSPVVIHMLPEQLIALGRCFPFFRFPIAQHLIRDSCLANASYALSTGLAAIVPVFDIPLNLTDMVVLTKNQAFLVYKLGLTLGLSQYWRDYIAEFGSVMGGGFLWRQLGRTLIGLIPAYGIIPKVGIAYAGTFVVGNTVLQWYLTGRHLSRNQMRELYKAAFAQGKKVAQEMMDKAPRPRLLRRRLNSRSLPADQHYCRACGELISVEARFCQHCGSPVKETPPLDAPSAS